MLFSACRGMRHCLVSQWSDGRRSCSLSLGSPRMRLVYRHGRAASPDILHLTRWPHPLLPLGVCPWESAISTSLEGIWHRSPNLEGPCLQSWPIWTLSLTNLSLLTYIITGVLLHGLEWLVFGLLILLHSNWNNISHHPNNPNLNCTRHKIMVSSPTQGMYLPRTCIPKRFPLCGSCHRCSESWWRRSDHLTWYAAVSMLVWARSPRGWGWGSHRVSRGYNPRKIAEVGDTWSYGYPPRVNFTWTILGLNVVGSHTVSSVCRFRGFYHGGCPTPPYHLLYFHYLLPGWHCGRDQRSRKEASS